VCVCVFVRTKTAKLLTRNWYNLVWICDVVNPQICTIFI